MPKYRGIIKKKNLMYYGVWNNRTRKLKWYSGFGSAEATHRSRLHKLEEIRSQNSDPSSMTIKDLCVYYLNEYGKKQLRKRTLCLIEQMMLSHIIPHIGNIKIQTLRPHHLKSAASKTTIPLMSHLVRLMKEWKLQCGSSKWVFKGAGDRQRSPDGWASKNWVKIKQQFGLQKDLRFHDLRHLFATILLRDGLHPVKDLKLLRHANFKATVGIHGHLFSEDLHEALDSLISPTLEFTLEPEKLILNI